MCWGCQAPVARRQPVGRDALPSEIQFLRGVVGEGIKKIFFLASIISTSHVEPLLPAIFSCSHQPSLTAFFSQNLFSPLVSLSWYYVPTSALLLFSLSCLNCALSNSYPPSFSFADYLTQTHPTPCLLYTSDAADE